MIYEQLDKYFTRIGFADEVANPTLDILITLQEKHAQTFPFENLNSILDIPVDLDVDSIFTKFVLNGRGGYCYEQNILFMSVLQSLGYDVRYITGRVYTDDTTIRSRTHVLLLISIDGVEYISDVGFGSLSSIKPLRMKENIEQKVYHDIYKIDSASDGFILKMKLKNQWRPLYLFDLQIQYFEDLKMGNWYTSTYPESHFRNNVFLSIKNRDTTYNLDDNILTTYHLGEITERVEIISMYEFIRTIVDVFKIRLDDALFRSSTKIIYIKNMV